MGNLNEYIVTDHLIEWAKANLKIIKYNGDLTDAEIRRIIRFIAVRTIDTLFVDDGKPILGKHGTGVMLSVTLLEFPKFYEKFALNQFN